MVNSTQGSSVAYIAALLVHYCFELGASHAEELVENWLNYYQANWIRLAVIEALYQGRYKAVSVEQLLTNWSRRKHPIYHFNHEFERLISRKLPKNITTPAESFWTEESLSDAGMFASPSQQTTLEVTPVLGNAIAQSQAEQVEADYSQIEEDFSFRADWSRWEARKQPIHQFIPSSSVSKLYLKLKAVAESEEYEG